MNYLEKLDMFTQKINFTLERKEKVQTQFGGILTLIFLSVGIFIFIENGKELYLKENPMTVLSSPH